MLTDKDFYACKFHKILFFTPSPFGDFEMDKDHWNSKLDIKWLCDKIEDSKQLIHKNKIQNYNLLVVFDDMITELKKDKDEILTKLFYNRRHILPNNGIISFIITT